MVYTPTVPRGPISAMYSTPGPAYGLPGLMGVREHDPRSVHFKAAAYSFGVKSGKFKDECSPGPAYYPNPRITRSGKDGTPAYSLYSRHADKNNSNTPGPGKYKPEEQKVMEGVFNKQPAYTFGVKHKYRGTDNTPAPNYYSLPGMLGKTIQSSKSQAPSYTLTGRSKIGSFHEDLQKTPGPGNYNVVYNGKYKMEAPHYSMLGRNVMPGDSTLKPGPGAHSPERVSINKRAAPGYSFGIRHTQYEAPLIVEVQD
ncbi:outer dense fiber 3-like [Brachionus plicatilis]|uniref:Outer dense fiber 3-like n=1 Tax=Brachionus plicatilis TaxID=10195 RepID=A0A3M7RNS5_BRAPC|nr:outer dense fiber 3-like [Brachionus plicatilis]